MSLKLIANYSKRLGLPQYSSHSYPVTVETEVTTIDDLAAESADLYKRLQANGVIDELLEKHDATPVSTGNRYCRMPNR